MKSSKIIILILAIFSLNKLSGQSDAIVGVWLTEEEDSKIEIFKHGNEYHGKIIWIKDNIDPETGKAYVDKHNPDKEKRKKELIGLIILKNLIFKPSEKKWDDGEIYDPNNGSTYSSYINLNDKNKLKLRGYLGFSLIGRTEIWTRVK